MRLRMLTASSAAELTVSHFDLAIVGEPVDDRGVAAVELATAVADRLVVARYHPLTLRIQFDDREMEVDAASGYLSGNGAKGILIESTTLGFPEMCVCCRVARRLGYPSLSFLYVEPLQYRRHDRATKVIQQRDFELSDEIVGYKPVPGAIASLDQVAIGGDAEAHNVVFLLGFEGERMDRAIEDLPIDPRRCYLVFGVPGFRPGWELDSFANNIRVLSAEDFHQEPRFCAADNPLAVVELLEDIYRGQTEDAQLFVAPIGTKPHGIGAALFATERDNIGLLYDHPKRKEGRSSQTGTWHLFVAGFGA